MTMMQTAEKTTVREQATQVIDNAHKLFQAGLGIVAVGQEWLSDAQEETGGFVKKLLERGEALEQDGRKFVDTVIEKRKKQADDLMVRTEDQLETRVTQVLERLNVPSKEDINALTKKIDTLSRKVNELKKARESDVIAQ